VSPTNKADERARELVKLYLAWLAFPDKAQKSDRERFIEHINAWLSMSCGELRKRNIEQVLRRAFQRAFRHIWAGHIASLKIGESKSSNSSFRDMASIKGLSAHFSEDVDPSTKWIIPGAKQPFKTLKLLVLRPARPVLHLAMVYPERPRNWPLYDDDLSLWYRYSDVRKLLLSPQWITAQLRSAEKLRRQLRKHVPAFNPDSAVRIRPI